MTKLVADTTEKVAGFTKTNSKEALLISQHHKLTVFLTRYQTARQGVKVTSVASQLEGADQERDWAFATFSAFVKANAYIKTEAVQKAYLSLHGLLKDYKRVVTKSYEVESAELTNLIAKLKTAPYQAAVTQLNLAPHLAALEATQTKFERLYHQRLNEQAALTPGQLKQFRKELETAYDVVADLVAINAYCQPDHASYPDLLKQLNAIRARYKPVKMGKEDKAQKAPEVG